MNLNDTSGCFNDYLSIEDNGYEIERFCGRPSNEYAFLSRSGIHKTICLTLRIIKFGSFDTDCWFEDP